jgi:hypothetical protein
MKKLKLATRPKTPTRVTPPEQSQPEDGMGGISGFEDEPDEPTEEQSDASDASEPDEMTDLPSVVLSHVTEWEGRDVFIGFPSYKHTNPATAWCLLATALDLGKEKVRFDLELGDAMIYHARNNLVRKFLETPAKWLVFVDDDMLFPIGRPGFVRQMGRLPNSYPDAPLAISAIPRLISHGLPIVGATYFTRHPQSLAVNSLRASSGYLDNVTTFADKVMPCEWVGTGLLAIHRSVFEKMMGEIPEIRPANDTMPWNFFQPGADGSGEDVAFCRRALQIGIQPHVDTMLQALHIGNGVYGMHTARP